ncbi:TetR/AcrR family transcriptional regulator [Cupriavidus plantarum]|uniref:TetR family transcriptional regulator n=1 Tax=Cupriavidus plantarum TaxID=942865 RepID=A0A316ER15_9BURK|nr:TetR/AcrR family transcriptional regulator [Cupriavidus plantarum]PWK33936.1 TetR family transcriptional regulator [Cupriavidus plantarum]
MEAIDLSPKAIEIVVCTQSLLATRGYNGFSYADISEKVGISKASIHHHFPSKAELVEVVVKLYREETRKGVAAIEAHASAPLERLHAYTGYWERCIRDGSSPFCICAMLASELPAIPEPVASQVRGHFQDLTGWLASILAAGAESKTFRLRTNADAEAAAFLATVHGGMIAARVHGNAGAFVSIVGRAVEVLRAA